MRGTYSEKIRPYTKLCGGRMMSIIYCAECEGKVTNKLDSCPHCGNPLSAGGEKALTTLSVVPVRKENLGDKTIIIKQEILVPQRIWSPGVAAVLSFLIPGLGQIYKGQIFNGLVWFGIVILGYCFVLPGIILHLCCIFGAASGDPTKGK
jgi:TM2 domain-containing membrane protein YozV